MLCRLCRKEHAELSKTLGVCLECIRNNWSQAEALVRDAHAQTRKKFSMPLEAGKEGLSCGLCVNNCRLKEGERGYCGIRVNKGGKIQSAVGDKAVLECYYDALPTNCVAMEFCQNAKLGSPYKNLAVFYGSCSFNCLFCQNWHYRKLLRALSPAMTAEELAEQIDKNTKCICYFGGDPTPQLLHAINTSELALKKGVDFGIAEGNSSYIRSLRSQIRICFETNGSMNRTVLKRAAEISLSSGGTIKFDLKTYDEKLNIALCGTSNRNTLDNFKWLAENFSFDYNFLVASTLLVPGYIDVIEVEKIAKFISSFSSTIPYALLAFHPQFQMTDLPITSKEHAYSCYKIAKKYLENVRLGNVHLLV